MYLKKIILLLIIIFSSSPVFAQHVSLGGRILDSISGNPLSKSQIVLSSTEHPNKILKSFSDDNGAFIFNDLPKGYYYLQIVSEKIKSLDLINLNASVTKDFYVSNILTQNIKEVVITKQKPVIEQKPDKTIINIVNSIYDSGRNSYDLLNKLPEVYADPLGNINFRGDQGVTIYLDGRKINIPSGQIKSYLKSIPSEIISSYELISTPGSEYDAQGNNAIINIVTTKNREFGLSGSLNGSLLQNKYTTVNLGGNANYRQGNWNFSSIFNYNNNVFYSTSKSNRLYKLKDQSLDQNYYYKERYDNYTFTGGVEYDINKNQKVGGRYQINYTDYRINSSSILETDKIVITDNFKKEFVNNQNLNLYYKIIIDSLKSDLVFNYDFINYTNPSNSYYINSNQNYTPFEKYFIDNPINIKVNTASADYNKKYERLIFQLGGKVSFIRTDNSNLYYQKKDNNTIIDFTRTNTFNYREDIQALYSNLTYSFRKDWTAKIGIRSENTSYRGISNNNEFERNKLNFFPSAYLRKKINKNNVFNFAYVLRIQRPAYEFLNPFIDYQDPFSIKTGNPNLKSAFSNLAELKYIRNSKYSLSLSYKNTKDLLGQVYSTYDNLVYVTTYENISNEDIYTVSANIPLKITNWWETNFYSYINHKSVNVKEGENKGNYSLSSFFVRNSSSFNLPKDYSFELSCFYKGNSLFYIYRSKPQFSMDLSFKKNWKNLTISAELTDIFNTLDSKVITDNHNVYQFTQTKYPTRVLSFGLSYNFSRGKKDATEYEYNEKNSDEKERIER